MSVEIKEYDVGLFIGMETVENTPVVMTGAKVQYATEVTFKMNEKTVKRDYRTQARPLDVFEQAVLQWWAVGAKMPYAYSGVVGTASPFADVFRMCGASATTTAATSVVYERDNISSHDSATIEMRTPITNGTKDYRRMTSGARGVLGISVKSGEDIVVSLDAVGKYYLPDPTDVLAPVFTAQRNNIFGAPRVGQIATKSLNNKALCLASFEATNFFGFKSEWMETLCKERAEPTSDESGTIKIQMSMPDWESEFNPYAYANRTNVQRYPFSLKLGTIPGKILEIYVAEVQPQDPVEIILPNKTRGMELTMNILHGPKLTEK